MTDVTQSTTVEEFEASAKAFLDANAPRKESEKKFVWGEGPDKVAVFEEKDRETELADVAKAAATNPADFELSFRMGKNRQTPPSAVKGLASRPTGSTKSVTQGMGAVVTPSGLGSNPLGTGPTMPPIATSPSGHSAVTSPNPLGNDAVFGSGFESLFGS